VLDHLFQPACLRESCCMSMTSHSPWDGRQMLHQGALLVTCSNLADAWMGGGIYYAILRRPAGG
jgi:hypothetical protein